MNTNKIVLSVVSVSVKCIIIFLVVFFVFQGGRRAYQFGKAVFLDKAMTTEENSREVTVTISEGDSKMDVGNMLERIGLIENAKVFYVQTLLSEEGQNLKPGKYKLNTSMTSEDIMSAIALQNNEKEEAGE